MTEFAKIFDAVSHATIQQILAFAALIIPGLISLRAYEVLRGGESRKTNDVLIDIVAYSFVTDLLGLSLLTLVNLLPSAPWQLAIRAIVALLVFLAFPVLLGWGWFQLQRRMVDAGYVADPVLKPWDKIFQRIAEEQKNLGVIATLRDGRKIGSRLLEPAYVSTFPAPEQIMFGELWVLDEQGRFQAPVQGSFGLLMDWSDIETLEFFEWLEVERYLAEASKEKSDAEDPSRRQRDP